MPKTKQQKIETVSQIQQKLNKAKAVIFADFRGLTMKQLSDLRDKLREENAEISITKNTLLERALPASSLREANQLSAANFLTGPTATLFAYDDEISPIKILVKAFKDAALGKVKFGFLGTNPLIETQIIQLSTIPSKDELKAKTVRVLAAPLQGMASVLQANLRNLVYALSEIKKQKGGV